VWGLQEAADQWLSFIIGVSLSPSPFFSEIKTNIFFKKETQPWGLTRVCLFVFCYCSAFMSPAFSLNWFKFIDHLPWPGSVLNSLCGLIYLISPTVLMWLVLFSSAFYIGDIWVLEVNFPKFAQLGSGGTRIWTQRWNLDSCGGCW
jgi:hypothetical protein